MGALAGWFSGSWLDRFVLGASETIAAFPALLLVLPIFAVTLIPDHSRPLPSVLGWLAMVVSATLAVSATHGWGGDRYALYSDGDDDLLVYATLWDSDDDCQEFAAAYQAYAEAVYGEPVDCPGQAKACWQTPEQALALAWQADAAWFVAAPDLTLAEEILAVVRQ